MAGSLVTDVNCCYVKFCSIGPWKLSLALWQKIESVNKRAHFVQVQVSFGGQRAKVLPELRERLDELASEQAQLL